MCFSVDWLVQILIWLVVVSLVVALIRIWILPMLAATDARISQTISWVLWAIIVIFCIYVIADLLMCVMGGGLGGPLLRHR